MEKRCALKINNIKLTKPNCPEPELVVAVDVTNEAMLLLCGIWKFDVKFGVDRAGDIDNGIGDGFSFFGVLFALLMVAPVLLQLLSLLLYRPVWNFGLYGLSTLLDCD